MGELPGCVAELLDVFGLGEEDLVLVEVGDEVVGAHFVADVESCDQGFAAIAVDFIDP